MLFIACKEKQERIHHHNTTIENFYDNDNTEFNHANI